MEWVVPTFRYLRLLLTRCRLTAPRPAGTSLRSCPNCLQAFSSFVKNIFLTEGNEGNEGASHYAYDFWISVNKV
jgi:hypothetical protein